jgi:hypothetical protein
LFQRDALLSHQLWLLLQAAALLLLNPFNKLPTIFLWTFSDVKRTTHLRMRWTSPFWIDNRSCVC